MQICVDPRHQKDIEIGDRVRDRVSGFKGIAISRTEWLFGCIRIQVQPEKIGKDGKYPESIVFDEASLEVIKKAAVLKKDENPVPTNGGGRDDSSALRRS